MFFPHKYENLFLIFKKSVAAQRNLFNSIMDVDIFLFF